MATGPRLAYVTLRYIVVIIMRIDVTLRNMVLLNVDYFSQLEFTGYALGLRCMSARWRTMR